MRLFKNSLAVCIHIARLNVLAAAAICGFVIMVSYSGQAIAGGEGFAGWKSHGLHFATPEAACENEWNFYTGPSASRFIGASPYPGIPNFSQCEWTTYLHGCPEPGFNPPSCTMIAPNAVSFECLPDYSPDGEDSCVLEEVRGGNACGEQGGYSQPTGQSSNPTVSNPILLSTGAKLENKTDFVIV